MNELKFNEEEADGLYLIFAGLSRSCYEMAEVYPEAHDAMKKAYDLVIKWGKDNSVDLYGSHLRKDKI